MGVERLLGVVLEWETGSEADPADVRLWRTHVRCTWTPSDACGKIFTIDMNFVHLTDERNNIHWKGGQRWPSETGSDG